MQRAFRWAAAQRFDLGILLTDKPALYQPYGFRSVPQHAFLGKAPEPAVSCEPARALSVGNASDVALIKRLLDQRQPVSREFAVTGEAYFLLNACFDPECRLTYLPACDAVIAWKQDGGLFRLLDIVSAEIPPLAAIIAGLELEQDEIMVCFPPDRIDWQADAQPQPYAGACDLMIADIGSIHLPRSPFILSPMAEF